MIAINIDESSAAPYRRGMDTFANLTDPDAPELFPAAFPRDGFPR